MAYFNFELIDQKELSPLDVFIMQLIFQNKSEDMEEPIALTMQEENLNRLVSAGLITKIKGKKSDSDWKKIRLSKKGVEWLRKFQTYQTVENDFKLYEYLKNVYLKEEKQLGSEKKTLELIAFFRCESGFNHKQIFAIAKKFVQDPDRMEYSQVLEKVFWKSSNHFQTKPKLEDSKLWNYYEENKEFFEKEFKKIDKK